jgi:hypothetical protein
MLLHEARKLGVQEATKQQQQQQQAKIDEDIADETKLDSVDGDQLFVVDVYIQDNDADQTLLAQSEPVRLESFNEGDMLVNEYDGKLCFDFLLPF